MMTDVIDFDTPYGEAHVVYGIPTPMSNSNPTVRQVAVECPGNIVWDNSTGKWYPEPQVVDYVLPRAWVICELLGVPAYEWLSKIRRGDIWAVEDDFDWREPIGKQVNGGQ